MGTISLDVSRSETIGTYLFRFKRTSYHEDIINWSRQFISTHGIHCHNYVSGLVTKFLKLQGYQNKAAIYKKWIVKYSRVLWECIKKIYMSSDIEI